MVDVNEELKFFVKIQKTFGVGQLGVKVDVNRFGSKGAGVGEGQGGCERRIEVFVKIQKRNSGGGGEGVGW